MGYTWKGSGLGKEIKSWSSKYQVHIQGELSSWNWDMSLELRGMVRARKIDWGDFIVEMVLTAVDL